MAPSPSSMTGPRSRVTCSSMRRECVRSCAGRFSRGSAAIRRLPGVAWHAGGAPCRADIRRSCFSALNFSFPAGEELIGYPVAGPDGANRCRPSAIRILCGIARWRLERRAADLPQTDGVHHETGIPPSLVRPELIAAMKEDSPSLFPPAFADVIGRMDGMFVQAIYDLAIQRMGRGRIAIIGDAAFVARPHCGAGVSKAADDAASLATALTTMTCTRDAIEAFSAERTNGGSAAVTGPRIWIVLSRWTGLAIAAPDFLPTGRRSP